MDRVGSGAVAECVMHSCKCQWTGNEWERLGVSLKERGKSGEGSVGAGRAQSPGTECPMWAKPGGVLNTSSLAASPAAWCQQG